MIVDLTPREAGNVRVAIRALTKTPEIDENGMKTLLVLSDKFVEKPVVEKKLPEKKK